jgi:hypothetical protein
MELVLAMALFGPGLAAAQLAAEQAQPPAQMKREEIAYVFFLPQPQVLPWAIRRSSANLKSRRPGQREARTCESQGLASAVPTVPLTVQIYAQEAWEERAKWELKQEEPAARKYVKALMTTQKLLVSWQAVQKRQYF